MAYRAVTVRELRNNTKQVLDQIEHGEEVVLTNRGKPIATIRPLPAVPESWPGLVDEIFAAAPPPLDTGMSALLATDDAESMDDLT